MVVAEGQSALGVVSAVRDLLPVSQPLICVGYGVAVGVGAVAVAHEAVRVIRRLGRYPCGVNRRLGKLHGEVEERA